MTGRPYIVGNWKMNGLLADLATIEAIDRAAAEQAKVDVALCPPFTLLAPAGERASVIGIGAQDCHFAASGAHTGNVSAPMLAELGIGFSIVGHSERRADQGETSALVAAKVGALHEAGLGAILCVGESLAIREAGDAIAYVTRQLDESLPEGVPAEALSIAYEPVWAIGTGRVAEVSDIQAMHAALRALLVDRFGEAGGSIRLLYGGSVNASNAGAILTASNVDGALVGGASLKAESFIPIIEAAAGR